MKTLTNLTAEPTDAEYREEEGFISGVHTETVSGFFRTVKLGSSGITISNGRIGVGIPLSELLALAERCEPRLAPPTSRVGE